MGDLERILEHLALSQHVQVIATGVSPQGLVEVPAVLAVTHAADGTDYYYKWWVKGSYIESVLILRKEALEDDKSEAIHRIEDIEQGQ